MYMFMRTVRTICTLADENYLVNRFWAGPIVIFLAMSYMELWVREKVVNGVMNAVVLVGHLFFLVSSVVRMHRACIRVHPFACLHDPSPRL